MTMAIAESEVCPDAISQYVHGDALEQLWKQNSQGVDIAWPTGFEYTDLIEARESYSQELINEGRPVVTGVRLAEKNYADAIGKVLAKAREELVARKVGDVAERPDAQLGEWIKDRTEGFYKTAELRSVELEEIREDFIERVEWAIDNQGFPLTKEQLHERIERVGLGFFDPLARYEGLLGEFSLATGVAAVSIETPAEELKSLVYHELLHGISAHRLMTDDCDVGIKIKRVGLEFEHARVGTIRTWFNEALTDLADNILLDRAGWNYEFDDYQRTFDTAGLKLKKVLKRLPDGDNDTYYMSYKQAALDVLSSVPAAVAWNAYFLADYDTFEEDPRAGIHAERELQRAIKATGGVQQLAQMRVIDKIFADEKDDVAMMRAREIRRANEALSEAELFDRREATAKHTTDYQARITRAKAHIAGLIYMV